MTAAEEYLPGSAEEQIQTSKPGLTLQTALTELQAAIADKQSVAARLAACFEADDSHRRAHALYRDVGEIALTLEDWSSAELAAVRSLKKKPSFGAAFKLMGLALRGAGRLEEAAICHRYGLPPAIRDQHFGDIPCVQTDSFSAGDAGVSRHQAFATETFPLQQPLQLEAREIVELAASELHAAEGFTTVIPGGYLWFDSFNTVAWDRKGRIVADICRGYAEVVQGSLDGREPLKLAGRVCLLGNRNSINYYHWMNDVLPRLAVLQASGHDLDSIDHFVVSPLVHRFHKQTLAELGILEDRLHTIDEGEYIQADELLMATYGSNSLGRAQGPWNPAFLQRSFGPQEMPATPLRRLYISRGSSGARGISNEEDLIAHLAQRGFEVVRAESMTVREQAVLFAEAQVVLGPHGAGFSNIAFCQPGTTVIELFSAHMAPCFWVISEVTGLRHAVHFCGDFDETNRPSANEHYHRSADVRRRSAFQVNIEEIDALLLALNIH
ncbi:MAG: glycosyltransferase 61 family protein [Granulosicoccus sp.]